MIFFNTRMCMTSLIYVCEGKSVIKMDLDATNEAAKIAHTTQEKAEALDARLNGKDSKSEEEKEKQVRVIRRKCVCSNCSRNHVKRSLEACN